MIMEIGKYEKAHTWNLLLRRFLKFLELLGECLFSDSNFFNFLGFLRRRS